MFVFYVDSVISVQESDKRKTIPELGIDLLCL